MSSQEYKDILLSLVNRTVLCCILILCHHLGIIVITHKLVERETRDNKYPLLIFLVSGACIICVWCLCLLSLCPWDSVLCAVIFYQLVLWGRLARLSLACHKINQPCSLILRIQNYQNCWTWISFKYIQSYWIQFIDFNCIWSNSECWLWRIRGNSSWQTQRNLSRALHSTRVNFNNIK